MSLFRHRRVYFDNAATTPLDKRVLKAMRPFLTTHYGNPSSTHKEGRKARMAVTNARVLIADLLGCRPDEIFFTSGASESNSWVVKNVISQVEEYSHDSVVLAAESYHDEFNPELVSYPLIDSETGGLHEFNESKYAFVDLTQAIGKVDINLNGNLKHCMTASFSAHKFNGPKGVGVLFIRKEFQDSFEPLIYGHQERMFRGGTENVAGIVGMATALEITIREMEKHNKHIDRMADYIRQQVLLNKRKLERGVMVPLFVLNMMNDVKIWKQHNIINITFAHLSAQSAVQIFDQYGIAISAGSACNSDSDEPSKTLLYYGFPSEEALRTIRVSLGYQNTLRECKKFIRVLRKVIDKYDVL